MNDDRLKQILQRADRLAGPSKPAAVDVDAIRRRADTSRAGWKIGLGAAAAAAAIGICVWLGLPPGARGPDAPAGPSGTAADAQRVAQLEAEVRELRASTDRALALLQELGHQRERDRRMVALRKELAAIPDPMDQVRAQVSQTAERMVREADDLCVGQRQRRLAAARYKRVIDLFPDNEWASVARQRLTQITDAKSKGESI